MAETPKGTCGPLYAWSFHTGTPSHNRLKSGKAKQMTNVIPFQPKTPTQTDSLEGFDDMPDTTEPARKPYSFDMTQHTQKGMVLLDACVPFAMATEFLQMLIAFKEAAVAPLVV
jgi:hypothetical protein